MGNCYPGEHIAEDYIHTDIIACIIREPQQKYRLGTVSNSLPVCIGGGIHHTHPVSVKTFQIQLLYKCNSIPLLSGSKVKTVL